MTIGAVYDVDINQQMSEAYLDYAMSVIVARALPDARDGLKPVHRRILYAMHELGLRANTSYKKSARIVGEVLGKYHPHGDMAVYDAMARMAQDFSMRYPLVDGQGNFGSVDGDSPAAMRYTEARLAKIAEELLADIDKNTVDFAPNFDDSLQEPVVLPSRLPNLLLNGSSGIAVGMATNIPAHNLNEVAAAINHVIDNMDRFDEISVEELLQYIQGPDFPTGGIIVGTEGIVQAYSTGRGRIILRGVAQIEEIRNGRFRIVITELPYQVNKASLISRIAELVRNGKLAGISDLRDESDRRGMRIVIELKRGEQPRKMLNRLYKYTTLQSTFGVQMLALVDGEPRLLSLKRALKIFIDHRQTVITRRTTYELEKARARAHVLEGLLKAIQHLDEVIAVIRAAASADDAKGQLVARFGFSPTQAQAILDMQLRRLAALERARLEEEYRQLREQIAYYEDLLAHPRKILQLIQEDMRSLVEKYGDERRTRILPDADADLSEEDLIKDEAVLIVLTKRGYIKRMPAKTFRSQRLGGRGIIGHTTRDEDEIDLMAPARSLYSILFFSDRGKVYSEKAYQIPEADRTGKGVSVMNVLALDAEERITAIIAVPDFNAAAYCTMATERGTIKRVRLAEFASVRPSGLIAIRLAAEDHLRWARLTGGEDHILLITARGRALRFHEGQVRPMGRAAAGVRGIRLAAGDRVASMDVVEPGGDLLVVTRNGYGKRTSLEEYPAKGRGTGGVLTLAPRALPKVGEVVSARVVQPDDDITLISAHGILLRLKVREIKRAGRNTQGVILMRFKSEEDSVAAVARIRPPRQAAERAP